MSTSPAVNPNTTPVVPDRLGTFNVCNAFTAGAPSKRCDGFPAAAPQKFARWKASMYWVVPMLIPPEVNGMDAKMGDATVFCTTVFPSDSTVEGSKVAPFEITILTGMITVGMVAELPSVGATPTML